MRGIEPSREARVAVLASASDGHATGSEQVNVSAAPRVGRLRRVPGGRGRQVRLRHPGRGDLDLNESLANSSVAFVPVRHEQGGAYMADMYGRLTGRAGVCLGTLGPGRD